MKFSASSVTLVLLLGASGPLQAQTQPTCGALPASSQAGIQATALVDVSNFAFLKSNGEPLDAAVDFVPGSLAFTMSADQDVFLDGATPPSDSDSVPNTTVPVDFAPICVGDCPQLTDNVFPLLSLPPTANFSSADQLLQGAPFDNAAGTTAPARLGNGAYTAIRDGAQAGSANSNNGIQAEWTFQLDVPLEGATIEMDVRSYAEAFVSAGEPAPSKAAASTTLVFTVTDLSTGAVVFSARPDAANQVVAANAASLPVDLRLTGIHTPGVATEVQLSLALPALASGTPYQLSLTQIANTDASRVAAPSIDIEKATNGVDADDPNAGDAPQIAIGNNVTWTYVVTNTGNVTLFNVVVTDDQGVLVSCPKDTLEVGESMECTANGLADDLESTGFTTVPGLCAGIPERPLYENMGRATGESEEGEIVEDIDPSHYCNPPLPAIDIEKATNGVDADDPNAGDAPQIAPGDLVTWTYVVTNTGNVDLFDVEVTDDQGVAVTCPMTTLLTGQSMICTAEGVAEDLLNTGFTTVPGVCGVRPDEPLYENMGRATGITVAGEVVEDVDPSHYCNPEQLAQTCLLIIDEDGVDNDMETVINSASSLGETSDRLINDDRPSEVGNLWLRWNDECEVDPGNPGCLAKMPTGQRSDEGWFALPPLVINGEVTGIEYADDRPSMCDVYTSSNSSGTEAGYNLFVDHFVAGVVPQDCLDKVRRVMPFRNQDLVRLVGETCLAIVYDSDISMNYEPIYGNLKGERLGRFGFEIVALETAGNIEERNDQWPYTLPESKSDTSLYDLWLRIEKLDPGAPFQIKINDQSPDSAQIDQATYSNGQLVVRARSDFAKEYGGDDTTPPTPADPEFGNDPNNRKAYMTITVDGADEGSDSLVDPFIVEVPMTWLGEDLFEFTMDTGGVDLDGRRVNVQTDEGAAYNRQINR